MSAENIKNKPIHYIITAISPFFAVIAIYSLFTPWVSGKLLLIGKTISSMDFPNVFWSVLIGCLAIIAIYIWGILTGSLVKNRGMVLAISSLTLVAASYFLYVYSQKPSIPGVRVSLHGGLLLCFVCLILAVAGAIVPINLLTPQKRKSVSPKIDKTHKEQSKSPQE